jgi:hypothetical protein
MLKCLASHPVRPELVEACPELVEGGERQERHSRGRYSFGLRQAQTERQVAALGTNGLDAAFSNSWRNALKNGKIRTFPTAL